MPEERIFRIIGNNKGLWCPFKSIFCQEGYCDQCQIYLDWQKLGEYILICAWCGKVISRKPNPSGEPIISHGTCPECYAKQFRLRRKDEA